VSLLAEVAARAGVPVEGVVRVVTRQPVSRRIEQRVVGVLDSLDPDQLRALERLASAGLPEVVTPSDEPRPARVEAEPPARNKGDELALQLSTLLEEVATALNELRRIQSADRQDRVDDLAVLVDLMTTSWRGVDRRLARLERTIARLEPPQEPATRLVVVPAQEQQEAVAPPPEPEPEPPRRAPRWRRWLAPATPLLFIGGLALALVAFDILASPSDQPRLATTEALQLPPPSLSSTTGGLPTESPPRVLAWPGQANTGYYLVRVLRGRTLVYESRPATPRVVLPASVSRTPGTYRWSVRAGVGAPAENRLGATIVESAFVVSG
jgi:hypothetical protein